MNKKLWWSSSSGRIELQMTLEQAQSDSHSGQCDSDVIDLIPALKKQLDAIAPDVLSAELKEYGTWDEEERRDHAANLERLVWIAGNDIAEQQFMEVKS